MQRVLIYYAHPGHKHSHVNKAMASAATQIADVTFVDLYGTYPRHNINIDQEQQRLLEHDIIIFQFPLFWYSPPSLIKEWQDLVLEYGFAYGPDGDKLAGKRMMLAISTASPDDAYRPDGYQRHQLHEFLSPLAQTAHLCKMTYLPPYVLHAALRASEEDRIAPHVRGYTQLITALRDETYEHEGLDPKQAISYDTLPIHLGMTS